MKRRPSPRERVAAHLRKLGYDVEPEDIKHVHGGRHKTLNDTLECWSVLITRENGQRIEIQGGATLTECARGVTLEKNTPETCLYGDLIAKPI
jgi:hypothetical protein